MVAVILQRMLLEALKKLSNRIGLLRLDMPF
jgi:hypothetical protein